MLNSRALVAPLALALGLLWTGSAFGQFYAKDLYVTDLSRGIEWLRCTVGQRWNPETGRCDGTAVKLSIDAAAEAIAQAEAQLGPGWRLPSRAELESLLCPDCEGTRIDPVTFPDTPADSF
jgi:formylglycine-generating enzyme required for sulfatase activity